MSRSRELLALLAGAQAGGFLAHPPGLDGDPLLGIAGVSGAPRPRRWDAVGSARAPGLPGGSVTFTALSDGTLVSDDDVPDGSLAPLADAVEETLEPPYRAAGVRNDGDVWSVAAERISVVELQGVPGDVVELAVVAGAREVTLDGEPAPQLALPALEALLEPTADTVLHAERFDRDLFAVDVWQL